MEYPANHLQRVLAEDLHAQILGQALPPAPPGFQWVSTPYGPGVVPITVQDVPAQPSAQIGRAAPPTAGAQEDTIGTALLLLAFCESSPELTALTIALECVIARTSLMPEAAAALSPELRACVLRCLATPRWCDAARKTLANPFLPLVARRFLRTCLAVVPPASPEPLLDPSWRVALRKAYARNARGVRDVADGVLACLELLAELSARPAAPKVLEEAEPVAPAPTTPSGLGLASLALPPAPPGYQWVDTPFGPGAVPITADAVPPQPSTQIGRAVTPAAGAQEDGIGMALFLLAFCESSPELTALAIALECVRARTPLVPEAAAALSPELRACVLRCLANPRWCDAERKTLANPFLPLVAREFRRTCLAVVPSASPEPLSDAAWRAALRKAYAGNAGRVREVADGVLACLELLPELSATPAAPKALVTAEPVAPAPTMPTPERQAPAPALLASLAAPSEPAMPEPQPAALAARPGSPPVASWPRARRVPLAAAPWRPARARKRQRVEPPPPPPATALPVPSAHLPQPASRARADVSPPVSSSREPSPPLGSDQPSSLREGPALWPARGPP
jgi:hypothetical protein